MKPLIGLTPIVDAGRDSLWMLPGYMHGLEAVGGIGMMLPLTDDAAMLKDIVDRVDGILLTGGNDVVPVLYGETKETFCGENDPRRDRMEARLIELALQADKPVFGICRGLQILNVVLGGTLYQDLKTQTGTEITHSMDKPYDRTVHEVNILPDTPLAALYGPGPLAVNSRHHQGIKGLAPALHAQAVASDGSKLFTCRNTVSYRPCSGTRNIVGRRRKAKVCCAVLWTPAGDNKIGKEKCMCRVKAHALFACWKIEWLRERVDASIDPYNRNGKYTAKITKFPVPSAGS